MAGVDHFAVSDKLKDIAVDGDEAKKNEQKRLRKDSGISRESPRPSQPRSTWAESFGQMIDNDIKAEVEAMEMYKDIQKLAEKKETRRRSSSSWDPRARRGPPRILHLTQEVKEEVGTRFSCAAALTAQLKTISISGFSNQKRCKGVSAVSRRAKCQVSSLPSRRQLPL